jgi:hypothetical protein
VGALPVGRCLEVGPTSGAFGNANSELEYRVADLAMRRLRSKGITEPTVEQQMAAINDMRETLEKNLSPKRVENLSRVYRITIDPSAHSDYFHLFDVAHEVTHGAQSVFHRPAYLTTRTRSTVTSAPPVTISSSIGSNRSTCASSWTTSIRTGKSVESSMRLVVWITLLAPDPATPWMTVARAKPSARKRSSKALGRGM